MSAEPGQRVGDDLGARLISRALDESGLTQTELARRAGTSQATVSAYVRGVKQPMMPTLLRLLDAAGFTLEAALAPRSDRSSTEQTRPSEVLARRRAELLRLATEHGAGDVRVFGSVARGDDGPGSDVDLLVRFRPGSTLLDLARFRASATELLGVSVDVIDEGGLAPADHIADEAVPV